MAATMRQNGTTSDIKSTRPYAPNKTLILSPPGLSSRPEALNAIVSSYDRDATDIQMLDRLAGGLVIFQDATYDIVLILTDADGTRRESSALLNRNTFSKIVRSLKVGGRLRSQDGTFGKDVEGGERREAILAGLIWDDAGDLIKPDESATQSVPLRFGKKATGTVTSTETPDATTKESSKPIGVGFVNFDDDLGDPPKYDDGDDDDEDDDDDDELIDEDTLLDEADLARPIIQPAACQPRPGKRRRACKDCSCGLKEKIEAEDSSKRAKADKALSTIKLGTEELAEVDFTVQGKVGSCGNCSLGDAFRCDGCPYIGLPAFKPGEEVRLMNDVAQL